MLVIRGGGAGLPGVRGALRDPVIGRPLSLLHAEPGRPWPVEDIARQYGAAPGRYRRQHSDT